MGTYFPMTSIQREAETMVYLRESVPNSEPEAPLLPSDVVTFMNCPSSSSGAYSGALPENFPSQSGCVNMDSDSNTSQQEFLLNLGGSSTGHSHLSGWGSASTGGVLQGLSLSLGPHAPPVMQIPAMRYPNDNLNITSVLGPGAMFTGEDVAKSIRFESEDDFQDKQFSSAYGIMNTISNSEYMKAAQHLLDEVVNVKKAVKDKNAKKEQIITTGKEADGEPETASSDLSVSANAGGNSVIELSGPEKQELQSRLSRLFELLDEVDRRYRQYYHQMQMVISSFDSTAGSGAAKPYTSLALQTISRHFRSLRDAINRQIHGARKSLGEEDASSNDKGIGISRLRYVDQKIRQQRALQQLGVMQQQAWRPQRGLPETSVSLLRAWLFEHFLHPYPKDSDKIMLARQTGLTRCQVSNWFINARVRLWKPMIEEMYKELGDVDMDSNSSSETSATPGKSATNSTAEKGENNPQKGTTAVSISRPPASESDHIRNADLMGTSTDPVFTNYVNAAVESNPGGFIPAAEMGRSGNANGISLTLGLQQCERGATDTTRHGFIHLRGHNNVYTSAMAVEPAAAEFDSMDPGNQPHLAFT